MDMEAEVQTAKATYNEALQNLEKISDEIHKLREDQKLLDFHEEVSLFRLHLKCEFNSYFCSFRFLVLLNSQAKNHIFVIRTVYQMTMSYASMMMTIEHQTTKNSQRKQLAINGQRYHWIPWQSQTAQRQVSRNIPMVKPTTKRLGQMRKTRRTTKRNNRASVSVTGYQSLRLGDRALKTFSHKAISLASSDDQWSAAILSQKLKTPRLQPRKNFSYSTDTKIWPTVKSRICSYRLNISKLTAIKIRAVKSLNSNFKALE